MAKSTDIPQFGLLSGIKVVHNSVSIAGPFAAELYADYGADVIWIENPAAPAMNRSMTGSSWQQDSKNMRNISMNISKGEGKEIFLKMMAETDVFIEASKGGQYDRWGLSDEVLWEQNPRLVIVHISGFGQTGDPNYVKRPSYDPIAQAFGGYMDMNGFPGMPAMPTNPLTADYITAFFAFGVSVAAVMKSKETGRGESIDLAQFELLMRTQSRYPLDFTRYGRKFIKEGNHSNFIAGYGTYTCKDQKEIYLLYLGSGVLQKGLPLLGMNYGSDEVPLGVSLLELNTPAGQKLEGNIRSFCNAHTAEEAEQAFLNSGVPCSRIMSYEDCLSNPQYIAREVFTEWKTGNGETIKGVNIVPKLKNYPGKIWRAAPNIGMDNEDILEEIGLSNDEIQALYEKGVIMQKDYIEHT
jgi:L-carnitine CoA-transferase